MCDSLRSPTAPTTRPAICPGYKRRAQQSDEMVYFAERPTVGAAFAGALRRRADGGDMIAAGDLT